MAKRTIIFILLLALTVCVALPGAVVAEGSGELSYTVSVPAGREAAAAYLQDNDYSTRSCRTTITAPGSP